ncbi:MAG TPA: hypothetical protein VKX25_18500 [Bryobacteraceae bacterium]|jgi:hypothetical protein|nr:hypothetical protein [Bryobacteraceae bacterium]
MALLTARSATIFISSGEHTGVYRSVEEVPPALRRKLIETTNSANSATILIADKRGREELVRALQGKRNGVRRRVVDTIRSRQPVTDPPPSRFEALKSLRAWLEFLLPLAIGASLWFLIDTRF